MQKIRTKAQAYDRDARKKLRDLSEELARGEGKNR